MRIKWCRCGAISLFQNTINSLKASALLDNRFKAEARRRERSLNWRRFRLLINKHAARDQIYNLQREIRSKESDVYMLTARVYIVSPKIYLW